MPIYEYECQKCGEKFEDFSPLGEHENKLKCPKCNNEMKRICSNINCG